jgi:hypothetical protein
VSTTSREPAVAIPPTSGLVASAKSSDTWIVQREEHDMTVASIKDKPDNHMVDPETNEKIELIRPLCDVFNDLDTWREFAMHWGHLNQIHDRLWGDLQRLHISG